MQNISERPICHRSEDLVTYLYGEANDADAKDFAGHMRLCDACRSEFAVFQQVHDSILQWRSEALGMVSFAPASTPVVNPAFPEMTAGAEKRLSAIAAIREFLNVSPLWLRGVTAFASVLLCILAALAISRIWQKPSQMAGSGSKDTSHTEQQFNEAVAREVNKQVAELNRVAKSASDVAETTTKPAQKKVGGRQNVIRSQSARLPHKRLTRKEREQLAADLRLFPSPDEDDLPFVLPDDLNW